MSEYLTTKELAELLRIKERKVYDLAASGQVPVSRAMGKLLFPRAAITQWIAANATGLAVAPEPSTRQNVFLGSHDPLLEWALRESRAGLATFFDGSLDGIERFAASEGIATGLHVLDATTASWNVPLVRARFASQPVVLVEWAWRERGLIVPAGNPRGLTGLDDIPGCRIIPRQKEAGSQHVLEQLLAKAAIPLHSITFREAARNETDAMVAVLDGSADATFGLQALAHQYRLDFVPVIRERFDLLVERRAWFEPPMQTLLAFCRSERFRARAREFQGYDFSELGRVWLNGA